MKYLVTGGAGFIGSHLVDALKSRGHHVCVIDDLSTGLKSNVHPHCQFFDMDAGRLDLMMSNLKPLFPFDGIFHLASTVGVPKVVADPGYAAWNIVNSAYQAAMIREFHPALMRPKLVLVSSSEVYGHRAGLLNERLSADIPAGPRWSYAAAKLATETIAPDVVVARIFNTIGPRQRPEFGMVVPRFMKAAATGLPLQVYTPNAFRSFACVDDTVSGLLQLMATAEPGIYNVGGVNRISIGDLAEKVNALFGNKSTIDICRPPSERLNDIDDRQPDLSKLQSLGWVQRWDLDETLEWTRQAEVLTPAIH